MTEAFISRKLLTRTDGAFNDTYVHITRPSLDKDGRCYCLVTFSNVKKYDAEVRGMDEFNAIECALSYVDGICKNSSDPEFFLDETESMFRT